MTDKYEFQVGDDVYEVRKAHNNNHPKQYERAKIKRVMKRFVETVAGNKWSLTGEEYPRYSGGAFRHYPAPKLVLVSPELAALADESYRWNVSMNLINSVRDWSVKPLGTLERVADILRETK